MLEYVPSANNVTDILTKGLGGQSHQKLDVLVRAYLYAGDSAINREC